MVGKLANSAMCFDNDAYESQHCFSLGSMYMYNSSQDLLVQCKSALFALKVFSVFYPVNLALKLFNNTMQLNFAPTVFIVYVSFGNDILNWMTLFSIVVFAKYFEQLSNNMTMQCVYTFEKIYNKYNCIWKIRNFAFVSLANLLLTFITYNTFECFVKWRDKIQEKQTTMNI